MPNRLIGMSNNTPASLDELSVFLAIVRAGGFRDAARQLGVSPSTVSETLSRLEASMGVRLLSRTTRSVTPTEAGRDLAMRLEPILAEARAAVESAMSSGNAVRGTLRLNVPGAVMFDILPPLVEAFLLRHPEVSIEIMVDDRFVDAVAAGCDAGIRYGERLAQDMIAVPIGPVMQQAACGASRAYLDAHGRPDHPRDLLQHDCIRLRFSSGAMIPWEFAREDEELVVEPEGRLIVGTAGGSAAVRSAINGFGIIQTFRNWIEPHFTSGALEPVLQDWWPEFEGPQLYFYNRRFMPAPLRAFVDFVAEARRAPPQQLSE
tara:strand:+ start:173538 stop:174494 length:957 start_codon:yes stop_codon:yes gene_type:complete